MLHSLNKTRVISEPKILSKDEDGALVHGNIIPIILLKTRVNFGKVSGFGTLYTARHISEIS